MLPYHVVTFRILGVGVAPEGLVPGGRGRPRRRGRPAAHLMWNVRACARAPLPACLRTRVRPRAPARPRPHAHAHDAAATESPARVWVCNDYPPATVLICKKGGCPGERLLLGVDREPVSVGRLVG